MEYNVLQLIWYSIVCVSYPDILDIAYCQGTRRGIFDSGGNDNHDIREHTLRKVGRYQRGKEKP
jgi:hypothetical protein